MDGRTSVVYVEAGGWKDQIETIVSSTVDQPPWIEGKLDKGRQLIAGQGQ